MKILKLLVYTFLALVFSTTLSKAAYKNSSEDFVSDTLIMDSLSESQLEQLTFKLINEHVHKNSIAIANGKLEEADFIIDLRRYYTGKVNPFIANETKEKELNLKIANFKKETGKAIYVLLSPLFPQVENYAPNYAPVTFVNQEKLQNDKNQIQSFREKYKKNVDTYGKLATAGDGGGLLYVESVLFLDASSTWKVKYDDYVYLSSGIEKSVKDAMLEDISLKKVLNGVVWNNTPSIREASLEKYLNVIIESFKSKFFKIVESSDVSFSEEMLTKLTFSKRLEILNKIKNGIIADKNFFGNSAGSLAAKLLTTAPPEQYKDLLYGLRGNELALGLIPKIYDVFPGGDNYTEFIFQITNFIHKSNCLALDKNKVITSGKVYKWFKKSPYHTQAITTTRSSGNKIYISISSDYDVGDGQSISDPPVKSDAEVFEWVGIAVSDQVGFLLLPSGTPVKNDIVFVPAIFLDWASQKKFNRDLGSTFRTTINLAAFATGVGNLATGTSTAVRLWASADIVFSGAALLNDNTTFKNYVKGKFGADGLTVLQTVDDIGTAFGFVYLSVTGIQKLQQFIANKTLRAKLSQMATDANLAKNYAEESKSLKQADDWIKNNADEAVDATNVSKLTSEVINDTKKYFIEGVEVGKASISNNGYLGFEIKIPSELQKQGYATQIVEDALNFYKGQNKTINGIQGKWLSSNSYEGGMSTNLKIFIEEFLHNGKTYEQAALNTPTGKIATKNGFTQVVKGDWDVLDLGGAKPADIYWIELKFRKP